MLNRRRSELLLLLAITGATLLVILNIYDYNVFAKWVIASTLLGPIHIYEAAVMFGHEFRVVYPPLAALLFILSVAPLLILDPYLILRPSPPLVLRIAIKAPILASFYALYILLRRRWGRDAALLYASSITTIIGLLIYTSDLPAALLAFLAVEALGTSVPLAAALLAIATLLKQSFALLLPPLLIAARRLHKNASKLLLLYAALIDIMVAPFILANGFQTVVEYVLLFHSTRPPQGLNPWAAILYGSNYNIKLATEVAKLWLLPFTALSAYTLLFLLRMRERLDKEHLYASITAILVAFLLFSKVVNPQYFHWVIPFIAPLAARYRRMRGAYMALNLAMGLVALHYLFHSLVPVVVHQPVFIEEEQRWVPPEEAEEWIVGVWPSLMKPLLNYIRGSSLYTVCSIIYDNLKPLTLLLSAVYIVLLTYAYIATMRFLAARKDGYRGGASRACG